jgi:hypothetical protein
MSQCFGRLVKDTPEGVNMLSFEGGRGKFHVPLRCERITRSGDLCESCSEKEKKTEEAVRAIVGTRIQGSYPRYLMGRVTEPIPFWSRLYDSAWFRLKLEEGYTISEETMGKIKKAVEKAYVGVEQVSPAAIPGEVKKPGRKAAATVLEQLPVVPTAAPVVKRRAQVKKVEQSVQVVARIEGELNGSDHDIVEINVRKQEVDGRMFYLDPKKDKLYDMKLKYVGRLKDGAIVSHPDSDAEV